MSLSQKLRRSLQLGLFAGKMAGKRLLHKSAAESENLIPQLLELHGLPQKVGQILSLTSLSHVASTTHRTEISSYRNRSDLIQQLESELKIKLEDYFSHFEEVGISASIAQVYPATLKDGRKVAVKIQHPHIQDTLHADLKALGWISQPIGNLKKGFDLHAYQQAIGSILSQEMDYRQETDSMIEFRKYAMSWPAIHIPQPIPQLCSERILTMTWIEGEGVDAIGAWSLNERKIISELMLRLFLRSCLEWKILHGDPHPGNYKFSRSKGLISIGLLDFGWVKRMDECEARALSHLIQCAIQQDKNPERVLSYFLELGFHSAMLSPMAHLLPRLIEVLFEPFCVRGDFDVARWELGAKVSEILGEFRWNFRVAGSPRLLGLIRAWQGLIQYLRVLNAPISWHDVFESVNPYIQDSKIMKNNASTNSLKTEAHDVLSKYLYISVHEAGVEKVKLTLKASSAADLCELIPPDILPKLEARRISLTKLVEKIVASHYASGEIFSLSEEAKTIRVWLE